jgi:hypothetical protein
VKKRRVLSALITVPLLSGCFLLANGGVTTEVLEQGAAESLGVGTRPTVTNVYHAETSSSTIMWDGTFTAPPWDPTLGSGTYTCSKKTGWSLFWALLKEQYEDFRSGEWIEPCYGTCYPDAIDVQCVPKVARCSCNLCSALNKGH